MNTSPRPLTTLADVKTVFGIADTSQDALLQKYINQASAIIEDWCDCTFALNTWTEFYTGHNDQYLILNDRPVISVTSVYESNNLFYGTPSANDLLIAGTDYVLELDSNDGTSQSGTIIRIAGVWKLPYAYKFGLVSPVPMENIGNIQVTYAAGYQGIPGAVQQACEMMIAKMRQMRLYGQMPLSKSFSDKVTSESITLSQPKQYGLLTEEIISLLAPYKKRDF